MKNKMNSGFILGGFTLIGMGVGELIGYPKAIMFIGIGIGLVVAAYLTFTSKNSSHGNNG